MIFQSDWTMANMILMVLNLEISNMSFAIQDTKLMDHQKSFVVGIEDGVIIQTAEVRIQFTTSIIIRILTTMAGSYQRPKEAKRYRNNRTDIKLTHLTGYHFSLFLCFLALAITATRSSY